MPVATPGFSSETLISLKLKFTGLVPWLVMHEIVADWIHVCKIIIGGNAQTWRLLLISFMICLTAYKETPDFHWKGVFKAYCNHKQNLFEWYSLLEYWMSCQFSMCSEMGKDYHWMEEWQQGLNRLLWVLTTANQIHVVVEPIIWMSTVNTFMFMTFHTKATIQHNSICLRQPLQYMQI